MQFLVRVSLKILLEFSSQNRTIKHSQLWQTPRMFRIKWFQMKDCEASCYFWRFYPCTPIALALSNMLPVMWPGGLSLVWNPAGPAPDHSYMLKREVSNGNNGVWQTQQQLLFYFFLLHFFFFIRHQAGASKSYKSMIDLTPAVTHMGKRCESLPSTEHPNLAPGFWLSIEFCWREKKSSFSVDHNIWAISHHGRSTR